MNKIDEYFKSSSSVIGELGAHKKKIELIWKNYIQQKKIRKY